MLRMDSDSDEGLGRPIDFAWNPLVRNVWISPLQLISTCLPSCRSSLIRTSARRLRSAIAFLPPSSDAVIADEKLSIWALRIARSTVGLGKAELPFVPV